MLAFRKNIHPTATHGSPVLVLLHGRGSHMGDLQGLARILPPGSSLLTPQAPHPGGPWGYGPGWAWYRYMGEDRAEPESLRASLDAVDGFLEALPQVLGFEPGPLVLGGFSQGGTTSLAYGLTHPGRVSGIVNLSGFLVSRETLDLGLEGLQEKPVFWAHGTQDPAVPFHLALRGWDRLRSAGIEVEAREYPQGHWVGAEEMDDLEGWMARRIPGREHTAGRTADAL